MNETQTDLRQTALQLGLTSEEYDRIIQLIGRHPSYTELGMFSVMWSEHCSYKNSLNELKKLPKKGSRLLVEAGEENAGLVDIGDGLAVAFKIESHNHPSAVEPYQGAATGVGGIMRDIFTMGARPIAALDSLRFGDISSSRTQYLMKGIVKGIGDYGNSFGVPTVAGDIFFDNCYNGNPLVNAMAVGIVHHDQVAKSAARGAGNLVMIVGSATGKDGIHGASFASEELSSASESKRPQVQVGDPFTEKLLLEATLEVIKAGLVVGIQDMGAAGITCSTSEMSARGNSGMTIDLDKVPLREDDMSAYQILLSESQERMLLVIKPEHARSVEEIFAKWDLHCNVIGNVTGDGILKMKRNGEEVVNIPAKSLTLGDGAPVYERASKEPSYIESMRKVNGGIINEPKDYNDCLIQLLCSPNISSKNWATEQYDSMVRTNTVEQILSDAAVIRIKGTSKALALKTDCNPRYVYMNPYIGGKIAVAEAARNVVCTGAIPIAITNCLNFGNPYDPEIFWQFKEAVRGISDACLALDTPVTGGNVSFHNEHSRKAIYPTPVIGMLGLIESLSTAVTLGFKDPEDCIVLLGKTIGQIGGSEYQSIFHGSISGDAPVIDLDYEKRLQLACLTMIKKNLLKSCHDVSDGGLAVCIAESCIGSYDKYGVDISYEIGLRSDFALFAEDQSRIVVSCTTENLEVIKQICLDTQIDCTQIGVVRKGGRLKINDTIDLTLDAIRTAYYSNPF